jgi:hypothetical protein
MLACPEQLSPGPVFPAEPIEQHLPDAVFAYDWYVKLLCQPPSQGRFARCRPASDKDEVWTSGRMAVTPAVPGFDPMVHHCASRSNDPMSQMAVPLPLSSWRRPTPR